MEKRIYYLSAFFSYLINLIITSYIFEAALGIPPFIAHILNIIGFVISTGLIIKFYYTFATSRHLYGINYVAIGYIVLHIAYLAGFLFDTTGEVFYISSYVISLADTIFLLSCVIPVFNVSRPHFLMTLRTSLVLSVFIITAQMVMYLLDISFFNKDLIISYLTIMFCYIFSYITSY